MFSPQTQPSKTQQLLHYFSSYLQDTTLLISHIKHLVYELIQIQPPRTQGITVTPDIFDVMAGCKKTYQDLRRTQSILRGHLKAKRSNRLRTISQPQLAISKLQLKDTFETAIVTPNYSQVKNVQAIQTPIIVRNKVQTATTLETKDSKRTKTCQRIDQTEQGDEDKRNNLDTPIQKSQQFTLSRSRSWHYLKKFQDIKQSRTSTMQTFQQNNIQCLTIIKKIRQEIKVSSVKRKKVQKCRQ